MKAQCEGEIASKCRQIEDLKDKLIEQRKNLEQKEGIIASISRKTLHRLTHN